MKKYFKVTLSLMLIVTSVVKAGPPVQCPPVLNDAANMFEPGKTYENLLNEGKWQDFKVFSKAKGKWEGIVQACCPSCASLSPPECRTDPSFQCGPHDERTWRCLCCWGDTKCYLPPRE